MKIYTLTIIKENHNESTLVLTTLYSKSEDAIKAYNKAFDEAKTEAENYVEIREYNEIATNTPYRWWSIYDVYDSYNRITIELEAKEVI